MSRLDEWLFAPKPFFPIGGWVQGATFVDGSFAKENR